MNRIPEANHGLQPGADDISLVAVVNILLRRWQLLLALPLVGFLLGAMWVIMRPAEFTATSRFVPQTAQASAGSSLAGLAAQFGVNVTAGGMGETPEFYAALIKSRGLLRDVASDRFAFSSGEGAVEGTLVELLEIDEDTEDRRLKRAIGELDSRITVNIDHAAGIVSITVKAPWEDLAIAVNERVLELLNEFNLRRRQAEAAAERSFVEGRLEEAREDLTAAETEWKQFLERNVSYDQSPSLTLEARRIQQRVAQRLEVYSSFLQAYDQARLEEARNTPVLTVVEKPEHTVEPALRHPVLFPLIGIVLGLMAAVLIAFIAEYMHRQPQRDPVEYNRFRQLKSDAWAQLRRPGKLFRRRDS